MKSFFRIWQIKNYLDLIRFNKPIGTYLLFLPCLCGLALSGKNQNIDWVYFSVLFFIGSFLMRSAGCIINDLFDKDFDKKVERTKNRPIASGNISVKNALIFLLILLLLAFLVLLQFNQQTIILGFIALVLVALYPLMKRITYYPQVFLGLTFNLGILFASTAIIGKITFASVLLYLANIIWTTIYDTIYGYQDLDDDLKIGVKSSSIKFGKKPQKILHSLAALYFLLFILLGIFAHFKFIYFIITFLAGALLVCQIKTCDFSNRQNCLQKFKSNIWVGFVVFLAIIFG